VTLVGAHNLSMEEIRRNGLEQTVAFPVAAASRLPSVLRPSLHDNRVFLDSTFDHFAMDGETFAGLIKEIRPKFQGIRDQFGIKERADGGTLERLLDLCGSQQRESRR